jgi:hypothetical protein
MRERQCRRQRSLAPRREPAAAGGGRDGREAALSPWS